MKLWAIGDVHGSADELECILQKIKPSQDNQVVFLGDLVGRGPNSKKVLDIAKDLEKKQIGHAVIGNHDKHFIDYLLCEMNNIPLTAHLRGWDILWGRYIRESFYIVDWKKVRDAPYAVPISPYVNFLTCLPVTLTLHGFFFTHKPQEAVLSMQSFCGHQTVKTIDITANPICMDTGAGSNGYLSAIECFTKEIISCPKG